MPRPAKSTRKRNSAKEAEKKGRNARVQRHRDKMRAAGLKPVTIWVFDQSRPGFAEEVRRQCQLINASADSHRVLDEMLAVADFSDWQ